MSLPTLKLTSVLALMFAAAAIGTAIAFLFLGIPLDRVGALVIGGFVVAAAFFTSPELVSGWIRAVLDRLPSFSRPKE
jgi:divalent metal cation (Fe/Co/Zn/Cd) transporter